MQGSLCLTTFYGGHMVGFIWRLVTVQGFFLTGFLELINVILLS
jgi:hypothetical protein